jgi:hypothetical protein
MPPHRLPDGTPVFHAVGELPVDLDEDRVCCGLCGEWFRSLGAHLRRAHDWNTADYRVAFGLNAQRPLQAPGVSDAQAAALKRRIQADRRLRAGMRKGLALARSGELNELGRRADVERGRALERQRRTQEQGRRIGRERAARFRSLRDDRARALGFADADELLRRRYTADGASVSELAAALGCAEITITAEMDRLAIARRPQAERLGVGRDALAANRAQVSRLHEARVRELDFANLAAYLRVRHHDQRWPRKLIAEELGVTVPVVAGLLRRADVPALRGLSAARAQR